MSLTSSRRSFFLQLLLLTLGACKAVKTNSGSLSIGVVSYDQGKEFIKNFESFNNYLAKTLRMRVELEPAYNENKAIERLENKGWSLVFATPGIAALAMSKYGYIPFFPLQEAVNNSRAILVVLKNSSLENLSDLEGQTIALGQTGSATGYYFPLYNLYGLTVAEVLFAATPKTVLQLVAEKKAAVGALSLEEFNTYKLGLIPTEFRILHTDSHPIPSGVVLIGSTIERNFQEQLVKVMSSVTPDLAQKAGYIPNAPVPNYDYMISVVKRVRPIANRLHETPARLF